MFQTNSRLEKPSENVSDIAIFFFLTPFLRDFLISLTLKCGGKCSPNTRSVFMQNTMPT